MSQFLGIILVVMSVLTAVFDSTEHAIFMVLLAIFFVLLNIGYLFISFGNWTIRMSHEKHDK
jgi:uncharacterized membrane protein